MYFAMVVEVLTVILDELFSSRRCLPSKDTSRCEMMTNHNVNNHIRCAALLHPHNIERKWIKYNTKLDMREMDANDIFSSTSVAGD